MDEQISRTVTFRAQRIPVGHDEGTSPESEPLFANHVELLRLNDDVFVDVGVITPADMIESVAKSEGDPAVVDVKFYILQRIAMSFDTLVKLHGKAEELLKSAKGDKWHAEHREG